MADWQDAYSVGDRIEKKIGSNWRPGTVGQVTLGMDVRGTLDSGIPFIANSADEIRKLVKAAVPAAKPAEKPAGAAKPAAPAAKPAAKPAKPAGKDNKGPPA